MQNQDMSMEEILASIRKIISEDKKPGEEIQFSEGLPESKTNGHPSSVLDLNQQIQEDGSIQILGSRTGGDYSHPARKGSQGTFQGGSSPRGAGISGFSREASPSYGPQSSAGQGRGPSPVTLPTVPSATQGRPASASYRDSVERHRPSSAGRGDSAELLMSRNTAAASLENLQKVMHNQRVMLSQESSQTLEGMVQEALKPLLRTWLDTHLPTLVERVVREQIHLLTRQV